jgi:acyl-CoA synthetase (AMP-forming)/AMP-acid ligase II
LRARLIVATIVAGGLALAAGGTMALAGKPAPPDTSKYPDLRAVVPDHLNLVNQQQNEYLRFSNGIANTGAGPLAMRPDPPVAEATTTTTAAPVLFVSVRRMVIVDPQTSAAVAPDEIGEIWVAGPSIARGYWNRPEESRDTFGQHLADTGAGGGDDHLQPPHVRVARVVGEHQEGAAVGDEAAVQRDAVPGDALHVRHPGIVIHVRAVVLFLLDDGEDAGGCRPRSGCRTRRGAHRRSVAGEVTGERRS